ncbi:MAG: 4Fe-4S binding protein [Proteobacteria bacterium]|nr:4Fe-4S binding protein [Pseudomonadota bacterium]
METDGSGALKRDHQHIPKIIHECCSGCGRCVAACSIKLITLETVRFHKNAVFLHPKHCTACGKCVEACPIGALLW